MILMAVNDALRQMNEDKEKTDWYMTNEVLKSLEDSVSVAEGGAYTYILTYKDAAGTETVLYSSEVVGGEEDTSKEDTTKTDDTATDDGSVRGGSVRRIRSWYAARKCQRGIYDIPFETDHAPDRLGAA